MKGCDGSLIWTSGSNGSRWSRGSIHGVLLHFTRTQAVTKVPCVPCVPSVPCRLCHRRPSAAQEQLRVFLRPSCFPLAMAQGAMLAIRPPAMYCRCRGIEVPPGGRPFGAAFATGEAPVVPVGARARTTAELSSPGEVRVPGKDGEEGNMGTPRRSEKRGIRCFIGDSAFLLEPGNGFEPPTCSLRMSRTISCANLAWLKTRDSIHD